MADPPMSSSLTKPISSPLKKILEPVLSCSFVCLRSPSSQRKPRKQDLPDLPTEIILIILSRLPSRSLCRFKSVSTLWLALITDPIFIKSHFHQFINDNNNRSHKVILGSTSGSIYCVDYQSLDYSSVELEMLLNYKIRCVFWSGSFNGTILLKIGMPASIDYQFFLWNPSIGMSQTFSDPVDVRRVPGFYGLGYDFVTDDFRVVWAGYSGNGRLSPPVHVFSSKIGSWRKIRDFGYEIEYHVDKREIVFKGMPHWVVGRNRNGIATTVIVCFDFAEEKFIEVPRPFYGAENDCFSLGVLGELLCVAEHRSERAACDRLEIRAAIWVMKEYGVKKSWTKLFVVPYAWGNFYINYFVVLCFTTEGDVVMSLNRRNLMVYNPKRNSYRRIDPKVCRQFGELFSMSTLASPHGCNDTRAPLRRSKWKRKWPFKWLY